MGFLDDLLGNTAADASRAAAADTYTKQLAAGNNYAGATNAQAQTYNPWIQTGQGANTAVNNLIADPSSVRSLPGYQFGLDQGNKSILAGNAATGDLFSGATGKALSQFGTNYADQTYGDQLARLLGVSQQGLGAQGSQNNMIGAGLQGQYNSAYGGAGTIGQGDVAAANARAKGITNLFGMGASVLGSALGGPLGGMAGGAVGSLFGGSPSYGGGNFLNSAYGGSSSAPLPGLTAADYGVGY